MKKDLFWKIACLILFALIFLNIWSNSIEIYRDKWIIIKVNKITGKVSHLRVTNVKQEDGWKKSN